MAVSFAVKPHIAPAAQAPLYEFFGCSAKILASGEETDGAYSLVELLMPAGSGTPPHIHHNEDEAFYILEGELTIWSGDSSYVVHAGDYAFLPRNVRHNYVNSGAGNARVLVLTNPAGFDEFIAECGVPTRSIAIPPMPAEAELGRIMTEIAPKYGIEMLVYA